MIVGAAILLFGLVVGFAVGLCFMAAWYGGINLGKRGRRREGKAHGEGGSQSARGGEPLDQDSCSPTAGSNPVGPIHPIDRVCELAEDIYGKDNVDRESFERAKKGTLN